MKNNITKFRDKEVEIAEVNGVVLFNPYDIGNCLELSNSAVRSAMRNMNQRQIVKLTNSDVHEVDIRKLNNAGENFLTESGVNKLIFKSNKPEAQKVQDWVFEEVLPSIRKNRGYISNQENLIQEEIIAKALIVAQNVISEKEKLNRELQVQNSELSVDNQIMKPKADYFDELVYRNLLTNFRETAKQLGIKEKLFIKFLIDKKYLYRDKRGRLMPYADKNNDLFEIKESINEKTKWSGTQTLITPKGRETFRLLFI